MILFQVYAVICCIVAGVNYGLEYPAFKSDAVLAEVANYSRNSANMSSLPSDSVARREDFATR